MEGGAWYAIVHAVVKSHTGLSDFIFTFIILAKSRTKAITSIFFCLLGSLPLFLEDGKNHYQASF